jgi:hypothetical protein
VQNGAAAYSLKLKGREEKERNKWRIIWFRKGYDVLRVDGLTVNSTAKDTGPTMYLLFSSRQTIQSTKTN